MGSAEFLGIHMTWNSVKQLNDLCSNSFSSFAPILHLNLTTNEEILKYNIELFWCKGEKQKQKKKKKKANSATHTAPGKLIFVILFPCSLFLFRLKVPRARPMPFYLSAKYFAHPWTLPGIIQASLLKSNAIPRKFSFPANPQKLSRISPFIFYVAQVQQWQ